MSCYAYHKTWDTYYITIGVDLQGMRGASNRTWCASNRTSDIRIGVNYRIEKNNKSKDRDPWKIKSVRGPLGLLFKLASPLKGFHPVVPDIILKENMDIAGFKVIFTPGHTNGGICLYQP